MNVICNDFVAQFVMIKRAQCWHLEIPDPCLIGRLLLPQKACVCFCVCKTAVGILRVGIVERGNCVLVGNTAGIKKQQVARLRRAASAQCLQQGIIPIASAQHNDYNHCNQSIFLLQAYRQIGHH